MAKIKQKINITEEEDNRIRRQWDIQRGRWYFSVTDVISVLTDSVDARNYWKALKNRLKNSHKQLVMDCNQLKMRASDGKSYLVDTADADTLVKIIQVLAPYNVPAWKSWFDHIEMANSTNAKNSNIHIASDEVTKAKKLINNENEISTDFEVPVDIFENDNQIIVKTFVAGFDSSSILISSSMNTLYIKGSRTRPEIDSSNENENFLYQELKWGSFCREIKLESFVDVDNIEATEFHGLITITLSKIDLDKTRFIKIKSL